MNVDLPTNVQLELRPSTDSFLCSNCQFGSSIRLHLYNLDHMFGVCAKWRSQFDACHSAANSIEAAMSALIHSTKYSLPHWECRILEEVRKSFSADLNAKEPNLLRQVLKDQLPTIIEHTVSTNLYYDFAACVWNTLVLRRSIYSYVQKFCEQLIFLIRSCKTFLHNHFSHERQVLAFLKRSHIFYKEMLHQWKHLGEADIFNGARNQHVHEGMLTAFNIVPAVSWNSINLYFTHHTGARDNPIALSDFKKGATELHDAICGFAEAVATNCRGLVTELSVGSMQLSSNREGFIVRQNQ